MGSVMASPAQLFREYERGRITRAQLHASIAAYARELIAEMVETRRNPVAAWFDETLSRQAAARLARKHGETAVREVLAVLGNLAHFAPARLLWNAGHTDVPLHCFLRTRREPVFRIREIRPLPDHSLVVTCEFGAAGRGRATAISITLTRDPHWVLQADSTPGQPDPG